MCVETNSFDLKFETVVTVNGQVIFNILLNHVLTYLIEVFIFVAILLIRIPNLVTISWIN